MPKHPFHPVTVVLFLMVAAVPTQAAETHVITVGVAQSVFDDYKALSDFIQNSPPAEPIPMAISLTGTAAMSDIVALARLRADEDGWLALDGGQRVHLASGDVVQVVTRIEGNPQTDGLTLRVVMVRGSGYAVVAGRADVVVPSGL